MGDIKGPSSSGIYNYDDFMTNESGVVIREQDIVDGFNPNGGLNAAKDASLNNNGLVAHKWGAAAGDRIFLGHIDALPASRLIIKTGDIVDTDGDWVGDAEVGVIPGAAKGGGSESLQLLDNGTIVTVLNLKFTGDAIFKRAIVKIPLAKPGDITRDDFVGFDDFDVLSAAFNSSPGDPNWKAHADINFDGFVGFDDFDILSANFNT